MKRKPEYVVGFLVALLIVGIALMEKPALQDGSTAPEVAAQPYELPACDDAEVIIRHSAYTLCYNKKYNTPKWVAWELTASETDGNLRRSNDFYEDPDLPARYRVCSTDYRGSGYDRGHMCPAADNRWDGTAMTECFYMSNMCPQNNHLNSGPWGKLEDSCRRWAEQEGSIYIVCGPIYRGARHAYIGDCHRVAVPEAFFKVVLSLRRGSEKAIGFVYDNTSARQTMEGAAMSVDAVEEMTGYDFFPLLDDKLEATLESNYNLRKWN